jgi:hypothetical protein
MAGIAIVLLLAPLADGSRLAAQDTALTFVTTAAVRVHRGPALDAPVIRELAKGARVTLARDSSSAGFWWIRTPQGELGWVFGRYLVPPQPMLLAPNAITEGAALASAFPACGGEHHFRWKQKKSTAQQALTPTTATVSTMLAWAPRVDLGNDLNSWCAERTGRELRSYRVTAWVRRIRKGEADNDWHVELTATKTSPVANCIVVEIPDPQYDSMFQTARDKLDALVAGSSTVAGDLAPPVRVKFTGAAFDDGWHGPHGSLPTNHGRCNSTTGAVWELHPVFTVVAP